MPQSSFMRVLVSHPHTSVFSLGVARGFERSESLAQYVGGVVLPAGRVAARIASKYGTRYPVGNRIVAGIHPSRIRGLPMVELASRGIGRTGWISAYNAMFVAHDVATGLIPWPKKLDAVYAYEDGALRTFRRAKRLGIARIWDLPLPHHSTIGDLLVRERKRWPDAQTWCPESEGHWKFLRKDTELRLATLVVAASDFTASSLERIELRTPVVKIPLGFPTDDFEQKTSRPPGPLRVLSVGGHDLRKGTPYLLEAWKRAKLKDAELRLVGRMSLTPSFLGRYAGLYQHVPSVPRERLRAEYQAADLLIFPTLGDGFGMVIQEAMCSGLPVLTTRCGGGPECVTHGKDGWIVQEASVEALVEALQYVSEQRDALPEMGRAARLRAERWTWSDAGAEIERRVRAHVEGVS